MNGFYHSFLFLCAICSPFCVGAQQTADVVILGAHIVTMDAQRHIFYNGGLAIRGDTIVAIGSRDTVETEYVGKEVIDASDSWLIPGLINTHTHAPMILLRGLGNDANLLNWLEKSIWPAEKKWAFDPTFIEDGMLLAGWEMALTGTTTHLNSYFLPSVAAQACKTLGLRSVCAQGLADSDLFLQGRTVEDLLKACTTHVETWKNDPLITPAIAPHSLYLCSPTTVSKALQIAEQHQVIVTMHAAETTWEKEQILKKYGTSVVRLLEKHGCLKPYLLLSHAIWLDQEEIELLAAHKVKVAHCPQSNMKLASGIAPINLMLQRGVTVSLGTDGPASNNSLDMFQEMDVAAKLQKVATLDATVCPANVVFAMATIDGAKALGLEKKIGSLEVNKCADIVLLHSKTPAMTPIYDPYVHLVYAVKDHCVESVLVGGKWVLRKRQLVGAQENVLLEKADRWQKRIREYLESNKGESEQKS